MPKHTTWTPAMRKRFKIHRALHIKNKNKIKEINLHMMVMKEGIKKKLSFSRAHKIAQRRYKMK